MKFLKEKNKINNLKLLNNNKSAFTLIELIVSILISSIIFFIVFKFITDSITELEESNARTKLVDQVFDFRDKLNKFIKGGYIEMSKVGTGQFETLLLKDIYSTKGFLFGVVNQNNMILQKDYLYDKNVLGYRLLSQSEITNIELNNNEIYNLNFYNDKLFDSLKIKDFKFDFYNSGTILDLNMSVLYTFREIDFGKSFSGVVIEKNDYLDFNLNY